MVSVHNLLYKKIDFDQTCIDTLLGGGKRSDFGDFDLMFKVKIAF